MHVQAQNTRTLSARRAFGPAVLAFCFRTKVDKTNDQKKEANLRDRARAKTQPLLLGWKYWKPSLGHLEMLIRLANSHCSWVASVELSV